MLESYNKFKTNHFKSHAILGYCYYQLGMFEKAELEWKKAYSINDSNLSNLYNLAQLYRKLNQKQKMKDVIDKMKHIEATYLHILPLEKSGNHYQMNRFKLLLVSICFFHFSFPKDHSFHSDYALEWCYFVGHIKAESGNLYGYELSFFRLKFSDGEDWNPEVFPVHFAISDLNQKRHETSQTIKRNLNDLAGYKNNLIYSGEFEFQILSRDQFLIKAYPKSKNIALELSLNGNGNILSHGKDGISIKSKRNPSIFSYYYSYPRLKTKGTLWFQGKKKI